MSHATAIPDAVLHAVLAALVTAFLLSALRLYRGPTLPDRVVALDLMTVLSVGVLGTYAILVDEAAFLDVAIVLSLITFIATIAFARHVEGPADETEARP
jgi:multicomponent Na+:H+ antiporter subunit F